MRSAADSWKDILDIVGQPVWTVDAGHSVRYANPAAAETMGYGRPADLLGIDGRPATAAAEPEAARLTGPERGEGTLTRLDGTLLPVEWTRLPLARPGTDTALYVFALLAGTALAGYVTPAQRPPLRRLAHQQVRRQRQYARTLQHGVQERMVRALLALSLARQELGAVPSQALDLLHDAARDTEEALAGVREITDALSPGALRAAGLPAALTALTRRSPVPMTVSVTFGERLPDLVESHTYLFVAEAVERAAEHGRAGHVQVTVDLRAGLVVTVADNGAAPTGPADLAALAVLTERAAALNGTLTVRHTPGTGTTVTAILPL
ncbi:hypothetical protein GCM10010129_78450 [Streptomyces fumigatiscleroticus]|nr:hypothetical protein GCM10010129_78450 [Streptomyces fumigatiscleroticus]